MGTTPSGLPYPEPTDPVAAGAAAIESLAEAVDTLVGTFGTIRAGTVPGGNVTPGGVLAGAATISLPAGHHMLSYIVLMSSPAAISADIKLFVAGVYSFIYQVRTGATVESASFTVNVTLAAPGAVTINIENPGTQTISTYADPASARICAIQGH